MISLVFRFSCTLFYNSKIFLLGDGPDIVTILDSTSVGSLLFMTNDGTSNFDQVTIVAPDNHGPTLATVSSSYISGLHISKEEKKRKVKRVKGKIELTLHT
jgi:hypothetical protein